MATVHITQGQATARYITSSLPVPNSVPYASDTMTSSGTSAKSSIVASGAGNVWSITVLGGNIWVKFGTNPTAAADDGWLILDGQTRDFGVTTDGEEVAIKDA